MNVAVQIDLPKFGLAKLAAKVTGPTARRALNEAMGLGIREITRDHLRALAAERHATADRLGASYSGHLEQAARAVEGATVTADAESATLILNHPGVGRAFHDVKIVPVAAKALAIPVAAIAYNRRPGQFAGELFVWKSKITGNAFLAKRQKEKGDPLLLYYLLVRSVTQKQDRSLLPSSDQWEKAAADAARAWRDKKIAELGGANS